MEWSLLALVLVAIALVVLAQLSKQGGALDTARYDKNSHLFSPAERSFFGVLNQAVQDKAIVLGKVRVADVLKPAKGMKRSDWQKAFNRISSKHVDYVLCNPDDLAILAVVELDDKSHTKGKRIERDRFLDAACKGAGLPIHRFKAQTAYNFTEVRNELFPLQAENVEPTSANAAEKSQNDKTQDCPKCSKPLVKRVSKSRVHMGKEFLACSGFPKCRYVSY